MIVLAKSKLEVSNVAKMALNGQVKRTTISPEHCPNTLEHRVCRMQRSQGSPIGYCSTSGYKQFKLSCKDCREALLLVYAKDKTLKDWRRARYTSWHDSKFWYGLRGMNINPKTNDIMIDCSCAPEVRKTVDEFIIQVERVK